MTAGSGGVFPAQAGMTEGNAHAISSAHVAPIQARLSW